jgi:signal transduction histidine kinase
VIVVLGATGLLNVLAALAGDRFRTLQRAWWWSPTIGLFGWSTLSFYTGGISSPFVAGFWLELALSPMLVEPRRIPLVTLAAVFCSFALQRLLGSSMANLYVATAFLIAGGALTFAVTLRFTRSHRSMAEQALSWMRQLATAESDLDDARTFSAIGEKTAQMTHAVRNAVHSLRGFAELLDQPALTDSGRRRALQGLRLAIDRLDELTRSTLRAESSPSTRRPTTPSVRQIVFAVIDEARQIHPGIHWVVRSEHDVQRTAMPGAELREVLTVLVQNAAQATGALGKVTVGVSLDSVSVQLSVRDEGSGMSSVQLEELFKQRATTKPTGTGFGLYLAQRTVEAHGGRIHVESRLGGGTTFVVRLPTEQPRDRHTMDAKPPAAA